MCQGSPVGSKKVKTFGKVQNFVNFVNLFYQFSSQRVSLQTSSSSYFISVWGNT